MSSRASRHWVICSVLGHEKFSFKRPYIVIHRLFIPLILASTYSGIAFLSFRKFYGRYGEFIQQHEVSLSQMLNDIRERETSLNNFPTDHTFHFHDLDT